MPEFVSQRRRWLNGAFFAAVYSLIHFRQVWYTDHSIARKVLLHIEFVYQFVSLMFTYFSLVSSRLDSISILFSLTIGVKANFYLTFYFIAGSLSDPKIDPFGHHIGLYIFVVLRFTCVLLICTQFILSMGNRPQGFVTPSSPLRKLPSTNSVPQSQENVHVVHDNLLAHHGLHHLCSPLHRRAPAEGS